MNLANFTANLVFAEQEAQAALASNPSLKWAKFIFTDDKPNGNKQRIPKDEFPNILKTGIYMPIKMASGKIEDGHEYAEPLGTITHLKEEEDKVMGLAAFWTAEREDDINRLKTMADRENNPQLSWEVWYEESTIDEDGIEDLHGCVVRASTIVGRPAYQGRTPILAMSAQTTSNEDEEQKDNFTMDFELKIKELEDKLAELINQMTVREAEFATLKETSDQEKAELQASLEAANTELAELRLFKQKIEELEAEVARLDAEAARLDEIKVKFSEAGVTKDESYFEENKEKLLAMEESVLEFLIQEMATVAKAAVASLNEKNIEVPNLTGDLPITKDAKKLGRLLREQSNKKD